MEQAQQQLSKGNFNIILLSIHKPISPRVIPVLFSPLYTRVTENSNSWLHLNSNKWTFIMEDAVNLTYYSKQIYYGISFCELQICESLFQFTKAYVIIKILVFKVQWDSLLQLLHQTTMTTPLEVATFVLDVLFSLSLSLLDIHLYANAKPTICYSLSLKKLAKLSSHFSFVNFHIWECLQRVCTLLLNEL